MLIQNDILERIEKINWFCNCGNQLKVDIIYQIKYLDNWKKTEKRCGSNDWTNISLEIRNIFTQHLHDYHSDKYIKWNKFSKEAREFIEEKVSPRIVLYAENKSLKKDVVNCVKWDIINAIMEQVYIEQRDPDFFSELLKVYESGNFPCGWEGKWPKGKLIVF